LLLEKIVEGNRLADKLTGKNSHFPCAVQSTDRPEHVALQLAATGYLAMATKKRILCVSWLESLLKDRKDMLEAAGFFVTSAYGSVEARRICCLDHEFDLIVLGYSIPRPDKIAFVEFLRANCKAPILSIRRHGDPALREADFSIDSENEREVLVAAAKLAIGMV
jgi:CheY-like chemotaxis protein